jgi:hypothetical protein
LAAALPDLKVVVLFDDVHAYGSGGRALVQECLNEYGLGRPAHDEAAWQAGRGPIPVVLTYSAVTHDIYKADVDAIRTYVEQRPSVFRPVDLKAFDPPSQDDLPYQQFFLSRAEMLVLRSDLSQETRDNYLARLHQAVAGVPSRLSMSDENMEVHALIDVGKMFVDAGKMFVFETADDDKALLALHGGR